MSYVVNFFRDFFTEFHDFVQDAVAGIPVVIKLALGRISGSTYMPRKPWRHRAWRFRNYWAWKRYWIAQKRLETPLKIKRARTYVLVKQIKSGRQSRIGPTY